MAIATFAFPPCPTMPAQAVGGFHGMQSCRRFLDDGLSTYASCRPSWSVLTSPDCCCFSGRPRCHPRLCSLHRCGHARELLSPLADCACLYAVLPRATSRPPWREAPLKLLFPMWNGRLVQVYGFTLGGSDTSSGQWHLRHRRLHGISWHSDTASVVRRRVGAHALGLPVDVILRVTSDEASSRDVFAGLLRSPSLPSGTVGASHHAAVALQSRRITAASHHVSSCRVPIALQQTFAGHHVYARRRLPKKTNV